MLEDVRGLRAEVDALSRRVAELEKGAAKPAARRPGARHGRRHRGTRHGPQDARAQAGRRAKARARKAAAKTHGGRHRRRQDRPEAEAGLALDLLLMAKAEFASEDEFVEVIDEVFAMMDADPEMGPQLRDADVPQRFEFTDMDLVVNVRAAEDGEDGHLHWEWSDEIDWEPKVKMAMSSETANKYFQGKENVAVALARRRIKSGGDVKAALSLIPITKPIYARYREYLEREHPHLLVSCTTGPTRLADRCNAD